MSPRLILQFRNLRQRQEKTLCARAGGFDPNGSDVGAPRKGRLVGGGGGGGEPKSQPWQGRQSWEVWPWVGGGPVCS